MQPGKLTRTLQPYFQLGAERLKFLAMVTTGHFIIHWFQQLFPMVLPPIKASLNLSDVQVGALTSARQMANGFLDLPSGLLADSLTRHRAAILASALLSMGLAYLLFGKASSFVLALLGAAFVGMGIALWHPAAAASLSNRFPERRATALAVHGMGATVSDTITPLIAGGLLVAFPWRSVLELQMLPALLLGALIWWALSGAFSASGPAFSQSSQMREIGDLARHPVFIGITIANGLMQMGRLVVMTFLPNYLQEHLAYSSFQLGIYIMLLHGMGTVSQPILGLLSDRFGRKAVLLPSFLMLGTLYLLLVVAAPGLQLALVVTAIGCFFYTLMNVTLATVMDVAGSKIQASTYGLTSLMTQLFVLPVPILAGYLIEIYGIASAFLMSGGFVLLGALVIAPLKLYGGRK